MIDPVPVCLFVSNVFSLLPYINPFYSANNSRKVHIAYPAAGNFVSRCG